MLRAVWAFLGGLFVGRGLRGASEPDSVKQARYDARRERRSWSNPNVRIAWVLVGVFLVVAAVASLFR